MLRMLRWGIGGSAMMVGHLQLIDAYLTDPPFPPIDWLCNSRGIETITSDIPTTVHVLVNPSEFARDYTVKGQVIGRFNTVGNSFLSVHNAGHISGRCRIAGVWAED
jgi:hypothetical protein